MSRDVTEDFDPIVASEEAAQALRAYAVKRMRELSILPCPGLPSGCMVTDKAAEAMATVAELVAALYQHAAAELAAELGAKKP